MGKANRYNAYDKSVADSRKTVENFGINRMAYSGLTSSFNSPPKGVSNSVKQPNVLLLDKGGELKSPIGFESTVGIISSGVMDIRLDSSGNAKPLRGFYYVTPQTGTTDTLDKITGKLFDGQLAILTGINGNTITITHNFGGAGSILCPSDTNYTLSNDESVILIDDVTAGTQTWRIIGFSAGASGLKASDNITWTGIHTFNNSLITVNSITLDINSATTSIGITTTDIIELNGAISTHIIPSNNTRNLGDASHKFQNIYLNSGFDISKIYFDGGGDTYITGSGVSGRINVVNDGTNKIAFTTNGLDMLTSNIMLDGDSDTYIESTSDDNIQFHTGGSVRAAISNSGLLMVSNITMSTGLAVDIEMNDNDVDFATGGTIDFHDFITTSPTLATGAAQALPANPRGYATIKIQGVTRYIPYYST